ncbi:uncharacterized protein LOC132803407 [Ziziphus jujuba]|uniref:Uncharacterized protein LOC132803407 n=2 Tax=Ziziphus jujuba TaxID=326968 RepID=A0ABM4A6H7_ZIZJJ|nr:uncharacterized protein LOC132803407 [Ziziphus jujuba]KAH7532633.1 hypothetical protein FEM48_Zijuj04G0042300 [Ziziphus jujuba var. spinosa]
MTVKPLNESDERVSNPFQKPEFSSPSDLAGKKASEGGVDRSLSVLKSKLCTESETDQESGGSSEEMESPKSVGQWRRKKLAYVHSQILKIREEDSHLGEDIYGSLSANDQVANGVISPLDVVIFARPILPCSPLGGKTAVKALH